MTFDLGKSIAPFCLLLALVVPDAAHAQVYGEEEPLEIAAGGEVDLVSSYVWRGIQLSDEANIQPSVWISINNLELGTWGSHGLGGDFHEQDFWLTYYVPEGSIGGLAVTINDYYANPDFGEDYFDFDGVGPCPEDEEGYGTPPRCAGGAHTLELVGDFTAASLPLDLLVAYNFHDDPENAAYAEAAYRPTLGPIELGFTVGGVIGESEFYYGTDGTALTNLGAAAGTTLSLGPLSVPIGVDLIRNPEYDENYFVARVSVAGEF